MDKEEAFEGWWKKWQCIDIRAPKSFTERAFLAGHASRDAEVAELKRRLVECLPILQDYARKNPHHDYQGRTQDPNGVHALLAVIESKGETNEPST